MSIKAFMNHHFRHFNARETLAAAKSYEQFVDNGGKILLAMAGAMSTAEIGLSLGEMIRKEKVHAISCTAANLEEDIFNATAHNDYRLATNYRDLSPAAEMDLRNAGMNRVTDTCIPETAIRHIERVFIDICKENSESGKSWFPYQVYYEAFERNLLQPHFQIPIEDSWVYAAWQKNLQIFTPGFEDCTLGNIFAARVHRRHPSQTTKACETGPNRWSQWSIGIWQRMPTVPLVFFQIGGGIAGDFAICSVPLILQDLEKECRYWRYFAQISDSTTSYGSYSGAGAQRKNYLA